MKRSLEGFSTILKWKTETCPNGKEQLLIKQETSKVCGKWNETTAELNVFFDLKFPVVYSWFTMIFFVLFT